jgi:phage N-6-adenine-methyltransferase
MMDTETQKTLFSSQSDEWSTPKWLFDRVNAELKFNLDAAASIHNNNALCDSFFHIENSALENDWEHDLEPARVWLNPPYSKISEFMKMAHIQSRHTDLICCLIPSRTDTKYFHDRCFKADYIIFLKGRLKFGDGKGSAPFPSCLVFFGNVTTNIYSLKDLGKVVKL